MGSPEYPTTPADAVLAECAASALRHAPPSMRAAHMAPKLDDLAQRLRARAAREGSSDHGTAEAP